MVFEPAKAMIDASRKPAKDTSSVVIRGDRFGRHAVPHREIVFARLGLIIGCPS
tara:strand:+ start:1351 stop:1512 length:162 start_codon:yes stop_codon:yes gene_type:complete